MSVDDGLHTQITERIRPLQFDPTTFRVVRDQRAVETNRYRVRNDRQPAKIVQHGLSSAPHPTTTAKWQVVTQEKTLKVDKSEDRRQEQWRPLDRLKVSALACMLAEQTEQAMCAQSTTSKSPRLCQPFNHFAVFDLIGAAKTVSGFERQSAAILRRIHVSLRKVFLCITEKLLDGFVTHCDRRPDRQILAHVANVDAKLFAHNATFDYDDTHVELARKYVYSALRDGQSLDFDKTLSSADTDVYVSSTTPLIAQDDSLSTTNPFEQILQRIKHQTDALLNRHGLFAQLEQECAASCNRVRLQNIVEKLQTMAVQKRVDNAVALMMEPAVGAKDVVPRCNVGKLVDVAFKALQIDSENALTVVQQLEKSGFFATPALLTEIVSRGALESIVRHDVRTFLLNRLVANREQVVRPLLHTSNPTEFVRKAMWMVFLTLRPLDKKTVKALNDDDDDDYAAQVTMIEYLYKLMRQNIDPAYWRSAHNYLHNFFLKNEQFYFARVCQKLMTSMMSSATQ